MSRSLVAWWCAATTLLSAFLLFQVQPIISKMILPWFGGGPAVWTTCMLFFQLLLLGGYAYAHWLPALGSTSRQITVHIALLAVAVVRLPITPNVAWKPIDSEFPTQRILNLLLANVAMPYLLLATTGPLVQRWFSRACPGSSPYRLYALSNIGSLVALLSYPFVFEPRFSTPIQGGWWSGGFVGFALLSGGLAFWLFRNNISLADDKPPPVEEINAEGEPMVVHDFPAVWQPLVWLALPALGSVALLAVTNHLCQDVAVVPFMWLAPLSLYLLSFILCFDREWWYWRPLFGGGAAVSILGVCGLMDWYNVAKGARTAKLSSLFDRIGLPLSVENSNFNFLNLWNEDIRIHSAWYLAAMFFICMMCHGELARCKPGPRFLTKYYLMISAGGAIGGILVAMACPRWFKSYLELNLLLATGGFLAAVVLGISLVQSWQTNGWIRVVGVGCMGLALCVMMPALAWVVGVQVQAQRSSDLYSVRNFYGVLHVQEERTGDPENHGMELINGHILHGFQFQAPEKRHLPTTYFGRRSGVGIALENYPRDELGMNVAVVGLGAGTLAAYGQPGDAMTFYEINPDVVKVAHQYFSFLRDSPCEVRVVLGDARLSLEREEPHAFDVLVLDAFSGDAIPVHLLTREAFDLYRKHLKPDGVIAIHVSNRHLDLRGVVHGLSKLHELEVVEVSCGDDPEINGAQSDWMLVTNNTTFLTNPVVITAPQPDPSKPAIPRVWTDQFSNLLEILK